MRTYINSQAELHVAEAARELAQVERYLERKTEEAFRLCVREEEQGCFLFETGFRRLDPVIASRLLRRCMEETGGLKDVERIHIQILSELMDRQTGSQAVLPGGRTARREYQGIRLEKKEAAAESSRESSAETYAGEGILVPEIPGSVLDGGRVWKFSLENAQKDQIIPQKTYTKWFDYDKINNVW